MSGPDSRKALPGRGTSQTLVGETNTGAAIWRVVMLSRQALTQDAAPEFEVGLTRLGPEGPRPYAPKGGKDPLEAVRSPATHRARSGRPQKGPPKE